jgi:hypothetical protein
MIPDDGTRRRSPCPPVVAPSTTTTKLLPAASPRCYQRLNSLSRTPSQQHPRRCTYRNALQQPWPLNTSNDDDEDLIRPARSTTPYSENNKTKSQSTQQGKEKKQLKNSPKQKPRNSKEPQNSTKSLESRYSTRCQEDQIPAPTKETFLYTTTFTLQTKNQNQKPKNPYPKQKPNPNQNLLVQQPKTIFFFFAKPRMETTSWKYESLKM